MAPFNPSVPDVNPGTFFHWPKPGEKPNYMSPTGIAAEAIGKGVEQGSEEINKGVEKYAENQGYNVGKATQADMLASTQTIYNQVFPNEAVGKPDSLTPGTSSAPAPVDQGIDHIAISKAAYDQGSAPGHIRETEYMKNLYLEASRLRSQWPGYRDYIDKGIERATGITPNANSYIKSMLSDINEVLSKKNSGDNHVINSLATRAVEGDPNANVQYQLIKAGKKTAEQGLNDYSAANVGEYQSKAAEQRWKGLDANSNTLKNLVLQDVRGTTVDSANRHLSDWTTGLGLTPDVWKRLSEGSITLEQLGVDPRNLASAANQQRALWEQGQNAKLDQPVQVAGTTTTRRRAGGADIDSVMKDGRQVFDEFIRGVVDKDYGYASRIHNAVQDANNGMQWDVFKAAGQGNGPAQLLIGTKLVKDFGGDQMIAQYNLSGKFGDLPTTGSMNAIVGHTLGGTRLNGLDGIKDTLATIQKETHGENPVVTLNYLRSLSTLVNAPQVQDQGKLNVLHHLFDEKEQGWIGLIKEGSNSIAKHDMFNRFTEPAFVQKVKQLSEQYDPQLAKNYNNWVFKTFSKDVFSNDLSDISNFKTRQGIDVRFSTPKNGPPVFDAVPKAGRYPQAGVIGQGQAENRADEVNTRLRKLNDGIRAIYNVYGPDAQGMVMRELSARGVIQGNEPTLADAVTLSLGNHVKPEPAPSGKTPSKPKEPDKPQRPQPTMNQANPAAVPPAGAVPGNAPGEHPNTVNEFIDRLKNSPAWPRMMEEFQRFQTREMP